MVSPIFLLSVILLVRRPSYQPNYQFVMELKYLKKGKTVREGMVLATAKAQLSQDLQHDDYLQNMADL